MENKKTSLTRSFLEKVLMRDMDAVSCIKEDCAIRGDYYKCYLGAHEKCPIYRDYIDRIEQKH